MNSFHGKKIYFYITKSIFLYFVSSWAFLTIVLFVQQASRHSEVFFSPQVPSFLIWQVMFAILPSVISFTSPMAVLIGVLVGFAKMKADGELTAIKASGVSNFQIFLPVLALGLLLSLVSFLINWKGIAFASRVVRQVILKAALEKIDSPFEPGIFNTDLPFITIYVGKSERDGSLRDVMIFDQRDADVMRLITGREGKVNLTPEEEVIEIKLKDVSIISLPKRADVRQKASYERVEEVDLATKTKKQEIIKRMKAESESLEELEMGELLEASRTKTGKEQLEARILFNRRLLLSVSPLLFSIFGFFMSIGNLNRGKGEGLILAFMTLTVFYLSGLLGEQLARTGHLNPEIGAILPVLASIALMPLSRFKIKASLVSESARKIETEETKQQRPSLTSLFDRQITLEVTKFFVLVTTFLTLTYLVFTAFELWKFVGKRESGTELLIRYLANLIPYVYLQLSPSSLAIATLAVFTIKSRQNEIVTWISSGKSIYRLITPCLLLSLAIGIANWFIQENIAPYTNRNQDMLRAEIRSQSILAIGKERAWVMNENKIYSLSTTKQGEFYVFERENGQIKTVTIAESASVVEREITLEGKTQAVEVQENITFRELSEQEKTIKNAPEIIEQIYSKPSHLTTSEIKEKIASSTSENEKQMLMVALEKRKATLLLPLLACILMASLAFSPEGKRSPQRVGYACATWLLFIWASGTTEQLGTSGSLDAKVAVWGPIAIFTAISLYMLSKAKT
ncbi:MAG: LptF/LptG family permease [Pyrinomonadaceae bacterium]|nr:LptF/LptG family permease [Pyrinomonadaceae bacterium]MCX7640989.1 LptF/LptG family permease [Pyrinomonadaceae bacterium]MDW8305087.1 LptF/LptG family permease [Acidobacteriota bacterium]